MTALKNSCSTHEHIFHKLPSTFGIECDVCGAMTNGFYSYRAEAIAAWNRRTQNIGKKECCEQEEEQEERVFMHVEAEKLMCPFGGDCIAYLCPFDGDCIAYQSLTLLIGKSFAEQEQQKDVGSVGRCTFDE